MKHDKKAILILKNDQTNLMPITKQTQKMREAVNLKIKQLGNKYYLIKNLFEKFDIKRDDLFYLGRQIENEYKGSKKCVHLQAQSKRMKEAIICWFAENLYEDIFQTDSIVLKKLSKICQHPCSIMDKKDTNISPTLKNLQPYENLQTISATKTFENIHTNTGTQLNNLILYNDSSINQEIDKFEFANIQIEKNNLDNKFANLVNTNFNYDKLLEF